MILYDYPGAPNPRRVKIFAAEKQIALEHVLCDMGKREHKSDAFLAKNPSGKIPVLELDDGRTIPESISICRYLEAVKPEPNLFGGDAYEQAIVDAGNRRIELELFSQIGTSWVNGPIVAKMGLVKPNAEAKAASDINVHRYYERLDQEFGHTTYVAANRYSVADITLLCAVDFATRLVGLKPDAGLTNLWAWHERVAQRPAVVQNPDGPGS